MSRSHILQTEYEERVSLARNWNKQNINMSAAISSPKNYNNNYSGLANPSPKIASQNRKGVYKNYPFSKSYADEPKKEKEKIKNKFYQSSTKKEETGYENLRLRTDQIINHHVQPR